MVSASLSDVKFDFAKHVRAPGGNFCVKDGVAFIADKANRRIVAIDIESGHRRTVSLRGNELGDIACGDNELYWIEEGGRSVWTTLQMGSKATRISPRNIERARHLRSFDGGVQWTQGVHCEENCRRTAGRPCCNGEIVAYTPAGMTSHVVGLSGAPLSHDVAGTVRAWSNLGRIAYIDRTGERVRCDIAGWVPSQLVIVEGALYAALVSQDWPNPTQYLVLRRAL